MFHSPETPQQSLFIQPRDPGARRRRAGWWALIVTLAMLLAMTLWPSRYLVQQPGPVANTLGDTEISEETVPVIEIDGAPTYDTSGALDLLTVQIFGNREQPANWLSVIGAWFDRTKTVIPVDEVFPPGVSTEDRNTQNQQLMVGSQQDAVAAALRHQGFEVGSHLRVTQIQDGAPADGPLEIGDEVIAINGRAMADLAAVQAAVRANGTENAIAVDVIRDGEPMTVRITPQAAVDADGEPVPKIGIGTGEVFEFPIDVTINLEAIGGPSAGMMFALGIIDKLTPEDLTGGERVAGTGTISAAGEVGPIGGVRQKMHGALGAGSTYFLAPAGNCNEVVGNVPEGLRVFRVSTLDDALAVLEGVRGERDLDALPTCSGPGI